MSDFSSSSSQQGEIAPADMRTMLDMSIHRQAALAAATNAVYATAMKLCLPCSAAHMFAGNVEAALSHLASASAYRLQTLPKSSLLPAQSMRPPQIFCLFDDADDSGNTREPSTGHDVYNGHVCSTKVFGDTPYTDVVGPPAALHVEHTVGLSLDSSEVTDGSPEVLGMPAGLHEEPFPEPPDAIATSYGPSTDGVLVEPCHAGVPSQDTGSDDVIPEPQQQFRNDSYNSPVHKDGDFAGGKADIPEGYLPRPPEVRSEDHDDVEDCCEVPMCPSAAGPGLEDFEDSCEPKNKLKVNGTLGSEHLSKHKSEHASKHESMNASKHAATKAASKDKQTQEHWQSPRPPEHALHKSEVPNSRHSLDDGRNPSDEYDDISPYLTAFEEHELLITALEEREFERCGHLQYDDEHDPEEVQSDESRKTSPADTPDEFLPRPPDFQTDMCHKAVGGVRFKVDPSDEGGSDEDESTATDEVVKEHDTVDVYMDPDKLGQYETYKAQILLLPPAERLEQLQWLTTWLHQPQLTRCKGKGKGKNKTGKGKDKSKGKGKG